MNQKVTDALLDFASKFSNFDMLPENVTHEAKRILIDGIGNILGGIASDKGKIGIAFARKMGGTPESTLIGVGGKFPASVAAFANSELLNGLDWDPVPHIPPIVLPPLLAVAEAEKVSGKQFLAALCVATEVALRLSSVIMSIMGASIEKYGKTPDVFGNSNESVIGAAIGTALLMGLDRERVGQALGISAYLCSSPVCRDWESTLPKSMIKYAPVSWLAQAGVQSAMLAREGYTGNVYTLDSEYGFPKFYCREDGVWDPDAVIEGIGEYWKSLLFNYKPYPCCRYLHSILAAFIKILDKYHFSPNEIDEVRCYTAAFVPHPDQYSVKNQIDAQFSSPYNFALVAHNYKIGPQWQAKRALSDPLIHSFMRKVKMFVAPEFAALRQKDKNSWYGRVEVDVDGNTYTQVEEYARGANLTEVALSDEDLFEKFRENASYLLPDHKTERAIELIMELEKQDNLDELLSNATL